MTPALLASLLLTVALGSGVCFASCGVARQRATWWVALGYAPALGYCAIGMLVALVPHARGSELWSALWPWVLAASVILWTIVVVRARPVPIRIHGVLASPPLRWWAWAVIALLAAHVLLIIDEAWLRPIFPWDAWLAWSAKAKAWFDASQTQAFVGPQAWLADTSGVSRTSLAFHYPELLARIELWSSAPFAVWNEVAVGTAWPLLWIGLLAGCYGQWRRLGVDRNLAIVGVYVLGSLPLLNVHAALAGYADIWVSTLLVFAVLAWQVYLRSGERAQLLLAFGLLLFVPLLKFEGFAWTLLLAVIIVAGLLPRRFRWRGLALVGSVTLLVLIASYALDLPWVAMVHRLVSGEAGGRNAQSLLVVLRALVSGLIVQNNWNLLWLLLPAVLLWRWRRIVAQRELLQLTLFAMVAMSLVAALFLFTPAAKWAESNTAINRLVLQIVPTLVTLAVLVLRDVDFYQVFARTDPDSAAPAAAE